MTEARITGLAWTLGVLAAVSLFVGLYAFIWPHSFYDHVLGVNRLPPYNQHLLTDVGGFYLGFAVPFAWAAVDRGRALVLATCAASKDPPLCNSHHATERSCIGSTYRPARCSLCLKASAATELSQGLRSRVWTAWSASYWVTIDPRRLPWPTVADGRDRAGSFAVAPLS